MHTVQEIISSYLDAGISREELSRLVGERVEDAHSRMRAAEAEQRRDLMLGTSEAVLQSAPYKQRRITHIWSNPALTAARQLSRFPSNPPP